VKILASLVVAAGVIGLAPVASAMPIAPSHDPGALVEQVGWRCGPGWHVNRWGHCVPNRRYRGYYPPRRYYAPPRLYNPYYHPRRYYRY
jgi:hypothetical protein